jgi:LacI family gluconate utilization system Gnt-I transcriptional repressor
MIDVAMRANVSPMTVSRALRAPNTVRPENLRRVEKAVREAGYVNNQLAGGLKAANRTKLVAAIIPSIQNWLFAATIQGLTDTLRANNISLMLGDSQYSQEEEERLIASFLAQRPSGIVLHNVTHTATSRRMLKTAGIPVVEVGDLVDRRIDLVASFSNFEASKAMTNHLIGRGYRTIGLVSVPLAGNERARARREGYIAAMSEAQLPTGDDLMLEALGNFDAGAQAIVQLLERRPDIDAVFLAGAHLAIGASLECRRRGWQVPQRVAIAGFDDWDVARQFETPITTLDIPRYEIGKVAAEFILRRLNGEPRGSIKPADLGFRIIQRAST